MSWTLSLTAATVPEADRGRTPAAVQLHLAVTASDPPPGAAAVHDAAYGGLTPGLRAAAAGSEAVHRWRVVQTQIASAEVKVADADRRIAAADRLKAGMGSELDLPARLRAVADAQIAAVADRDAALADLATLRPLAPELWRAAAVELNTQWVAAATARSAELRAAAQAAQADLARLVAAPGLAAAVERVFHARRLAEAASAAAAHAGSPVQNAVIGPEPPAAPAAA